MAHARRNFVELHVAKKSEIARSAIELIGKFHDAEHDARDLAPAERLQLRRTQAAPVAWALHEWVLAQRVRGSDGTATAKAIDYGPEPLARARAGTSTIHACPSTTTVASSDPAMGGGSQELVVRRNAGRWPLASARRRW